MNNIINLGEVGENSESLASKANTNYLFGQNILKFDLQNGEFFWGDCVNVKLSNLGNN